MRQEHGISSELEEIRRGLKEFRESHRPRTRLPEELWTAAAALVSREGLYRTARILHLDYSHLKKRVEGASHQAVKSSGKGPSSHQAIATSVKRTSSRQEIASSGRGPSSRQAPTLWKRKAAGKTAPASFVELIGESIAREEAVGSDGAAGTDCVIEVEVASGARMRIRTRMSAAEVVGLIGEWRERTSQVRGERS